MQQKLLDSRRCIDSPRGLSDVCAFHRTCAKRPNTDKKKKKKRKDRERKEKQPSLHTSTGASMLTPDLTAEPLSEEDMTLNISRFVARSIAEGSLQGLMLAAKLVLSFLNRQKKANDAPPLTFPLASHHS